MDVSQSSGAAVASKEHDPGDSHGRNADAPSEIPVAGWRDVFWRVYSEVLADRVTLIAAGVTYYIVLAIFPGMGALVPSRHSARRGRVDP